ncbi:hypothetical protein WN944_020961 [Citrus x changshan-huyou]|uniref:Uncharacterized protein n=1 Tax=Citrus x changshan-huyou TaxID=2935761 RepID=A0AAP0QZC3_9ROSI
MELDLNIALPLDEQQLCQASQVLTQVQASNVGSSSDPKKGPEFARALAKKAGVYNKVKGLSVPEPKLNRLDKIAPNLQQ